MATGRTERDGERENTGEERDAGEELEHGSSRPLSLRTPPAHGRNPIPTPLVAAGWLAEVDDDDDDGRRSTTTTDEESGRGRRAGVGRVRPDATPVGGTV